MSPYKECVTCKTCGKEFQAWKCEKRIYCSASCRSKDGNFKKGQDHQRWSGNSVGYSGLHKWINKNFEKKEFCEICRSDEFLEWSNVSGNYTRDKSDWQCLCKKCHAKIDRDYRFRNEKTTVYIEKQLYFKHEL